jgi:RimJ/RimL family protein N-acetyltransferase
MGTLTNWAALLSRSSRDSELMRQVVQKAAHRIRSEENAYGLRRDLNVPHTAPEALIPIDVRPIREEDIGHILGSEKSLTPEEKWDRASRLRLLKSGVGTCYVAVNGEDKPCYIQWLFSSRDNDFLQSYFHGSFPVLTDDTALLEHAFTPTAFRGQRIMSAATSRIAERARSVGARYVITFVGLDNAASLKGCARAGFEPYILRNRRWFMLRSQVTFQPVAS